MKKSLVLLLMLIVLISGTAYYAQGKILKEKDQVQVTEKVLLGDKSVVDGVTVDAHFVYDYKLFWDTIYEIGEVPKVQTEYRFYPKSQVVADFSNAGSMSFVRSGTDVMTANYEKEETYYGLQIAMKELYDNTPNGSENSTTIYLKDYMNTYDFMPELQLPFVSGEEGLLYNEFTFPYYHSEDGLRSDIALLEESGRDNEQLKKLKSYLADVETFRAFFKIPVVDTEVYKLAIEKDENGVVVGMGDSHNMGGSATGEITIPDAPEVENSDYFNFDVYSAFDNGDCYFTFNPRTVRGELVDVSQIPGGYGIYHFTYDSKKGEIDLSDLKMIYPLNFEQNIIEIRVDGSGENILLLTSERGHHYMQVIDRDTMTLVDKFMVGDEVYYYSTWTYEDYIVIATENLIVFELGEDGRYTQAFSVDRNNIEDKVSLLSEYLIEIPNYDTVFDWNGEMLLIANRLIQNPDKQTIYDDFDCKFYVAVVSEQGLLYYGEYETSLANQEVYFNTCHFNTDMEDPILVRWK